MALRDMSNKTMIALSDDWLTREELRVILERAPVLAAMLPWLQEAHTLLRDTHRRSGDIAMRIRALIDSLKIDDGEHDDSVRGVFYGLLAGRYLYASQPEVAARYESALERLLPDGRSTVRLSYLDQAGAVHQLEGQVDDDLKALLAGVRFAPPDADARDLEQTRQRWFELAMKIGRDQQERHQLEAGEDPETVSSGAIHEARLRWIQVVNSMLTVLPLSGLDEADQTRLTAALRKAEQDAARRKADGVLLGDGDVSDGSDEDEGLDPVTLDSQALTDAADAAETSE